MHFDADPMVTKDFSNNSLLFGILAVDFFTNWYISDEFKNQGFFPMAIALKNLSELSSRRLSSTGSSAGLLVMLIKGRNTARKYTNKASNSIEI
jgi:hypothetical protein